MRLLVESYLAGIEPPSLGTRVRCGSSRTDACSFIFVGIAWLDGKSRPVVLRLEQVKNSLDEELDFLVVEEGFDLMWVSDEPPAKAHVRRLRSVVFDELFTDRTWPSLAEHRTAIDLAPASSLDAFEVGDALEISGDPARYLYCGQYRGAWLLATPQPTTSLHTLETVNHEGVGWTLVVSPPCCGSLRGARTNPDLARKLKARAGKQPYPGRQVRLPGGALAIFLCDPRQTGARWLVATSPQDSPEPADPTVLHAVAIGPNTYHVLEVDPELTSLQDLPTPESGHLARAILRAKPIRLAPHHLAPKAL